MDIHLEWTVITITIVIFWSLYHPATVKNVNYRGRIVFFKIKIHSLAFYADIYEKLEERISILFGVRLLLVSSTC